MWALRALSIALKGSYSVRRVRNLAPYSKIRRNSLSFTIFTFPVRTQPPSGLKSLSKICLHLQRERFSSTFGKFLETLL